MYICIDMYYCRSCVVEHDAHVYAHTYAYKLHGHKTGPVRIRGRYYIMSYYSIV